LASYKIGCKGTKLKQYSPYAVLLLSVFTLRIDLFMRFIRCLLGAWMLCVCCGKGLAEERLSYGDVPDAWPEDALYVQTLPVDDRWWEVFGDSLLCSLLDAAMEQSPTVRSAMSRMEQARAQMQHAWGALAPSFSLDAGRKWSRGERLYSTSVSMQWEVDLLGRLRDLALADKALYQASRADYENTMISMAAQVATAYFSLRENQQVLEVLLHNVKSQRRLVNITQTRFRTGLTSRLDVSQALSSLYSTQSSIPSVEASIDKYINTLAVLTGVYPDVMRRRLGIVLPVFEPDFTGHVDVAQSTDSIEGWGNWRHGPTLSYLPDYVAMVGVGIPAGLLRRRPDVRAAEWNVEAQAKTLGATRKEWWPSFYVSGSFGFAAEHLGHLFRERSQTWSIEPSVSWNFFSGLQHRSANRVQRALLDEAIDAYNLTLLTAVQEVETAMAAYKYAVKEYVELRMVVAQGRETLDLSVELYKQGLTDFLTVLNAQSNLLEYESNLAQVHGSSLLYLVQLYQALSGGY
jgi:outer membrane protein TolC